MQRLTDGRLLDERQSSKEGQSFIGEQMFIDRQILTGKQNVIREKTYTIECSSKEKIVQCYDYLVQKSR